MGSSYTPPDSVRTRRTPSKPDLSENVDKFVGKYKSLSKSAKAKAVKALRTAGLGELAAKLEALFPTGSRPAKRD